MTLQLSGSMVTVATLLVAACIGGPPRTPDLPSISPATLAGRWKLTKMMAPSGYAVRIEGATQEIQVDGDVAIWTSGNDGCHGVTSRIPITRVNGGALVFAVTAGTRRCGPAPCVSDYKALPVDPAAPPTAPWEGHAVVCPNEDARASAASDYRLVKATDQSIELTAGGPWTLHFER